jgi:protein TonB
VLVSSALHVGGGALTTSLASVFNKMAAEKPPQKVEVMIVERKPPPLPPPAPKAEEPKPEPPKVVPKKLVKLPPPPPNAPPPPEKLADVPPPPNQEAKAPSDEPPMIVPGLTLSSTSTTGTFAVNVGNTLYGKPDTVAKKAEDVKPYKAAQYAPSYAITENPVDLNNLSDEELRKYYPPDALKQEIEGEVRTKITIDDDGSVVKVVILENPGHGFDEAARKILMKKRFKPAKLNGQAVATEIPFTLHFELPY